MDYSPFEGVIIMEYFSRLIAEASYDEDSTTKYGSRGNQIGAELHARPFYIHKNKWKCVVRCTDKTVSSRIVSEIKNIILNGGSGYSQSTRYGFLQNWLLSGMDGSATRMGGNCDCSALTYMGFLKATGYKFTTSDSDPYMVDADGKTTNKRPGKAIKDDSSVSYKSIPVVRQYIGYHDSTRNYGGYIESINSQASGYSFNIIYSTDYLENLGFVRVPKTSSVAEHFAKISGGVETETVYKENGLYTYNSNNYIDLTKEDDLMYGDVLITYTGMDKPGMTGGHIASYI